MAGVGKQGAQASIVIHKAQMSFSNKTTAWHCGRISRTVNRFSHFIWVTQQHSSLSRARLFREAVLGLCQVLEPPGRASLIPNKRD
jgi:hypothetical protein